MDANFFFFGNEVQTVGAIHMLLLHFMIFVGNVGVQKMPRSETVFNAVASRNNLSPRNILGERRRLLRP